MCVCVCGGGGGGGGVLAPTNSNPQQTAQVLYKKKIKIKANISNTGALPPRTDTKCNALCDLMWNFVVYFPRVSLIGELFRATTHVVSEAMTRTKYLKYCMKVNNRIRLIQERTGPLHFRFCITWSLLKSRNGWWCRAPQFSAFCCQCLVYQINGFIGIFLVIRLAHNQLWSWSYDMMTSSNGNILRVTGHLCGNSPVNDEVPAQRPVTRSFDVFFDLHLKKRLKKQWWGWWFESPSCPLWRFCNE